MGLNIRSGVMRWRQMACADRGRGFYIDPPTLWTCNKLGYPLKMAKAERSNPKDKDGAPSFEGPRHRINWLGVILCFATGVLALVAMAFFTPGQNYLDQEGGRTEVVNGRIQQLAVPTHDKNPVGDVGVLFTVTGFKIIGGAAWLVPVFLLWMAYTYSHRSRHLTGTRMVAMIFAVTTGAPLLAMQSLFFMNRQIYQIGPGGW